MLEGRRGAAGHALADSSASLAAAAPELRQEHAATRDRLEEALRERADVAARLAAAHVRAMTLLLKRWSTPWRFKRMLCLVGQSAALLI